MYVSKFFLFLIFCLSGISVRSQTSNQFILQGRITDKSGNAISHAQVFIESLNIGTVTTASGEYILKKVPEGVYKVSVSFLGFQPISKTVKLSGIGTTQLDFTLVEESRELYEVVVEGQKETDAIEEQAFNVKSLDIKKFENTSLDINQILGQTAGVRIRETGGLGSDFNFFLNGLSGRQVKFFLDGQPLENFGSLFNLNNIPSNLVERVDIYKGAVPIQLGSDALGGAINVVTKQNIVNYLDLSYSFGSFNTHRANLSGSWRNKNSGFTLGLQSFFNFSDNDFIMRNLKTVSGGEFMTGDFKRFHDRFKSYLGNLEIGFTDVSWADRIMIGFGHGALNKDLQTSSRGSTTPDGAFAIPVAGEAFQEEKNNRYTIKYSKSDLGTKGLEAKFFLSYNTLRSKSVDTTSNRYNWQGQVTSTSGVGGEISFDKLLFRFDQNMFLGNLALQYNLNVKHQFSTNFTWNYLERQGRNIFREPDGDPFRNPNTLDKKVLGAAYQLSALENKFKVTLSGKYYALGILAREAREFQFGQFTVNDLETQRDYFGYGLAVRHSFSERISLKTSYERTYRIPEAFEIFGDGLLILSNPSIGPENSHNFNLGTQFDRDTRDDENIRAEINSFFRVVDDMIFPSQGGRFVVYENIQDILIRGIEGEVRYSSGKNLDAGINFTYQDVLNNVEFIEGTGEPNIVHRERMYNTPFFFANADVSYGISDIGKYKLKLLAYYNANYVQEFFLNYPSIATGGAKSTVPTQFLHHVGLNLSSDDDQYNLGLEIRNLTDEQAFDNFALQKPGRAFFIKLRYFITH